MEYLLKQVYIITDYYLFHFIDNYDSACTNLTLLNGHVGAHSNEINCLFHWPLVLPILFGLKYSGPLVDTVNELSSHLPGAHNPDLTRLHAQHL